MSTHRFPLPALAGLVVATWSASALATSSFPGEVQNHLGLSYTPECSVCHSGGQTGSGTANTPFAMSLKSRGLAPGSTSSLDTALDALTAENTDSDHDGLTDVAELAKGTDPNVPEGADVVGPPQYGCAVSPGGATTLDLGALLGLALVASRLRRRAAR